MGQSCSFHEGGNQMRFRISTSAAPALVFLFISLLFIGASSPAAAKFRGPQALAVSPDGKRVYVTDTARAGVDVIDAETHQLISTIPASDQFYLPALSVSPDGSHLH